MIELISYLVASGGDGSMPTVIAHHICFHSTVWSEVYHTPSKYVRCAARLVMVDYIPMLYPGHGTNVTSKWDTMPIVLIRFTVSFVQGNCSYSYALTHPASPRGYKTAIPINMHQLCHISSGCSEIEPHHLSLPLIARYIEGAVLYPLSEKSPARPMLFYSTK